MSVHTMIGQQLMGKMPPEILATGQLLTPDFVNANIQDLYGINNGFSMRNNTINKY